MRENRDRQTDRQTDREVMVFEKFEKKKPMFCLQIL